MRRSRIFRRTAPGLAVAAALAVMGMPVAHGAEGSAATNWLGNDIDFTLSGYARGWVSMNLENQPELKAANVPKSQRHDSAGKLSMVRGSVLLDADLRTGPLKWKAIGRVDREIKTNYLNDLENLRKHSSVVPTDGGNSITENYNNADMRELWVEAPIGDRITVKFGKQQLVWGESDFFHAMDLVHGYDLSWRLFFEGENEEWRKPLILLSTKIRIPEANGLIAAYIRPGWDRCEDIGNTYDVKGGRWFFQPYRGYDLSQVTGNNCRHKEGDMRDVTWGIRWQGEAFDVNYSIAYLTTFSADPVASSVFNPYKGVPVKANGTDNASFFDMIHPQIDVVGATVSGYSAALDAVLSAEVAYTFDQPYNYGRGALGAPNVPGNVGVGLGGVMTKDTLTTMLRIDKNLKLEDILHTTRPSFSSIQLFDTMVIDYSGKEDLVRLFAYGTKLQEHSTILTAFTVLNYKNDEINPSFAVGFDLSNGGGFAIPAVSLVLNANWNAKIEADIFWARDSNKTQFSNGTSQLFGYFDNASQLVMRVTRQF
ncbi:MAG TPA: DUF1302 family protein [Methyloversatilis sp.]